MSRIDHEYTDEIVCPHCGYEHSDSFEYSEDGDTTCNDCGKPFHYARDISVTYSTDKLEFETCPICGDEEGILDTYHSSLGKIETRMCESCLEKEKTKLRKAYIERMESK